MLRCRSHPGASLFAEQTRERRVADVLAPVPVLAVAFDGLADSPQNVFADGRTLPSRLLRRRVDAHVAADAGLGLLALPAGNVRKLLAFGIYFGGVLDLVFFDHVESGNERKGELFVGNRDDEPAAESEEDLEDSADEAAHIEQRESGSLILLAYLRESEVKIYVDLSFFKCGDFISNTVKCFFLFSCLKDVFVFYYYFIFLNFIIYYF